MLYELIYRSKASDSLTEKDLKDILDVARAFNGENDITGCLLYNNRQFLQLLEGEFNVLMALYEKIKVDQRHKDVFLLHMRETDYRIYPDWTMAFKAVNKSEMKEKAGVTEFTQIENESDDSALSKQLFETIGKEMS